MQTHTPAMIRFLTRTLGHDTRPKFATEEELVDHLIEVHGCYPNKSQMLFFWCASCRAVKLNVKMTDITWHFLFLCRHEIF